MFKCLLKGRNLKRDKTAKPHALGIPDQKNLLSLKTEGIIKINQINELEQT